MQDTERSCRPRRRHRCGLMCVFTPASAPQREVERLLEFGAVYTCPVPPEVPDFRLGEMSAEAIAELATRREAARRTAGKGVRPPLYASLSLYALLLLNSASP